MLKAAAPIAESARLVELLEQHLAGLEPSFGRSAGNGVAYAACSAPASARRRCWNYGSGYSELGGNASLVVQRCPLSLKQEIDVWGDPGSSLALMRALKEKLDPRATLNPGRYVGRL